MTLTLALASLGLLAGGATFIAWRQRKLRRFHQGLVERLTHRFPAVSGDVPDDAFALRSPPGPSGHVAIHDDGLLVQLDLETRPLFRHIPWDAIHHVDTTGTGVFRVHISGVGDLAVPLAAGRKIWDGTLAARSGGARRVRQPGVAA